VVNLYGGPGSGKSTMAARLFAELKEGNYNAELVTEYAKDLTWEKRVYTMQNQLYIFANQQHRLWRLQDVQVIITDSPLLLSLIYGRLSSTFYFQQVVFEEYNRYQNLNVFLNRTKEYNAKGRSQSLEQAKLIDVEIKDVLEDYDVDYLEVPGNAYSTKKLLSHIHIALNKKEKLVN
jgi:adenylate kinase family enzyme